MYRVQLILTIDLDGTFRIEPKGPLSQTEAFGMLHQAELVTRLGFIEKYNIEAKKAAALATAEPAKPKTFRQALTELINSYSLENESGTPDFVLAKFADDAIANLNAALHRRRRWYGNHDKGAAQTTD